MRGWSAVCFRPLRKRDQGPYEHHGSAEDTALSLADRRSFICEEKKGVSVVELVKKEGSTLGLIISGGVDKGVQPKICNLRPGSIAHRSDALEVGDHIISVNGIRTNKLKHDEIVNLLKNAEGKVTLEVEYEIPAFSTEKSLCVCPKVIQVSIGKENGNFGFTLRGGVCSDKLKSRPLIITNVRQGGPADREGTIKAGDRLLAIDNFNVTNATLPEALSALKEVDKEAVVTIEYDISVIDAVKNASGPLLIEIDKAPCSQLGITLTSLGKPNGGIVIESISQASIAERCGALHVGDHILSIDGTKLDQMTPAEAMQFLKTSTGEVIKLEILPMSRTALCRVPETTVRRGLLPSPNVYPPSTYNTLSSVGNHSSLSFDRCLIPQLSSNREGRWGKFMEKKYLPRSILPCSSNISLLSSATSGVAFGGHVCHTETLAVTVVADHRHGYGFHLQGATFTTELMSVPLIISNIDQGGPAEKTGVIQVGDRVLSVNGQSTEGLTAEEVMHLTQQSYPRVTLEIEFDVAESVIPSTGTFLVKLAKSGGGLGITISSPKRRRPEDPLLISNIKKGSVAHRTGTIQPGDKLLAVDNVRMENCTVEDAAQILKSCEDIVPLRIQKDESFSEDPNATGAVVYTVELVRHGGPLGITISGTEEPFDPVIISGLTEGGLAQRTGALHVGDRLIAINGHSLRGKPPSQAILLLQNSGDVVNLKISKNTSGQKAVEGKKKHEEITHGNFLTNFVTPLPSVDSAVESWDSSALEASITGATRCHQKCADGNSDAAKCTNKQCPAKKQTTLEQPSESCWDVEVWDIKSQSTRSSHSYPASRSSASEIYNGDWSHILEDLETCGQSQLLRQIEQSIMGSNSVASCSQKCGISSTVSSSLECENCHSKLESSENVPELNSCIEFDKEISKLDHDVAKSTIQPCRLNECVQDDFLVDDSFPDYQESYSLPTPVEVHHVTLFKDQVYEDFGFSVSDGLYERGVYVNRIRPGGPADLCGIIKPYDRILQVNDTKTDDYDCCLTVPLIASSGDQIKLVITRLAYGNPLTAEGNFEDNGDYSPWVDDVNRESDFSSFPPSAVSQPLTKTL